MNLPPDLGRLPSEVEITLFRILQEGLTNIHRHSHASEAGLSIVMQDGRVRLEITDSGCGIPQDLLQKWRELRAPMGVGIAGMLERTRDMGGSYDVQSSSSGTTLTIVITISEADVKATRSAPEQQDSWRRVSAA